MTNRAFWFSGCVVGASMFIAVLSGVSGAAEKLIEPEMTPKLRLGKLTYDIHCAKCHGVTGAGTDKGPTFVHRVYRPGHHGDASFYRAVRQGSPAHHWRFGNMKALPDVTEAQIGNIILYIRALQRANGLY